MNEPLRGGEPQDEHGDPRRRAVVVLLLFVLAGAGGLVLGLRASRVDESAVRMPAPSVDASRLGASTPGPALLTLARDVLGRTLTVETLRSGAEELGTGWLLDNRGDFVTNAHVIEGRLTVRLRDRDGGSHDAQVIGVDRNQDVALLRSADGFNGPPLPVRTAADLAVPQNVVAIASSRATGHDDLTSEQLTALDQTVPVQGDVQAGQQPITQSYSDMLELRGAMIYSGNSGGPVLDADGQVIGIVTLGNKTAPVAFAIPVSRVLGELQGWESRTASG